MHLDIASNAPPPTSPPGAAPRAARHARPLGWAPPGPQPLGECGDPSLKPGSGETLSFLAGDWRIFQLSDGHRWSLDDHVTAVIALQEAAKLARPPLAALDLGCGIGSVLLMVAWGLPAATCVLGVEAQDVSVALCRRSIRYNVGEGGRVAVLQHDLRHPLPPGAAPPAGFDIVTGTPPYIPLGGGAGSRRPQKEPCNLETRGGVEEYVAAAARVLAPGGAFIVVMGVQGQQRHNRVDDAAASHGLAVTRSVDVVPREGKPPLMRVSVLRWAADAAVEAGAAVAAAAAAPPPADTFVVRLADGSLGPDMHAARAAIGMPPVPQSARGTPRL